MKLCYTVKLLMALLEISNFPSKSLHIALRDLVVRRGCFAISHIQFAIKSFPNTHVLSFLHYNFSLSLISTNN